ncbi:MAG: carboxypeptidase regulatory-like domain-containing protein [Actinocatenispora sp.]
MVLIVLVVAILILLVRRGRQHHDVPQPSGPPGGVAAQNPTLGSTMRSPGLGHPPAAPNDNFTPASGNFTPASGPMGTFTPIRHEQAPAGAPGAELPRRMPGRPYPAIGVRELAAAARHNSIQPVLHGTVRGDDGSALANAVLTVINVTGGQAGTTRTGPDGGYQLSIPEEGGYVLIARGVNHEPHASTVEVRRPHTVCDIQLTSAAGLMGLVTDASGAGVPDATVILTNTTGVVISAQRTNVQGGYTVTDLPPGLYTVTVAAEGFDPVAGLVDVPPTGVVRQNITFAPRRASLRGIAVHESDGRPLADVSVRLMDPDGRPIATIHTGPDGRYEFGGLGMGRYTVVASGYPEVTGTVELADEAVGEFEVRMGHRATLSGRPAASAAAGGMSSYGAENSGLTGEERGR